MAAERRRGSRPAGRHGHCLPGYRWCGPGCSGPGAPLNAVDACCRAHDKCYQAYGGPNCRCDREFLRCLESRFNPYTKEGRDAVKMHRIMRFVMSHNCSARYRYRGRRL